MIDIDINDDERKSLRGYMFMTEKPLLIVVVQLGLLDLQIQPAM